MTDTLPIKRKKRGCLWLVIGIGVILALLAVPLVFGGPPSARGAATQPSNTVAVTRGTIVAAVLGSGTINPKQSLDLTFQTSGIVHAVLVSEGDSVKAGQVLATLDDRDLTLKVETAQANLRSAEARLQQTASGNATPEDLAASQASVDSAAAQLDKTVTGNVTAADIAASEASLASAEAQLRKAQTGNVSATDIASAEASVRSAQAKLDDLRAGPKPEKVSSAQTTLDQARSSLDQVRSTASNTKTQAQLSRDTAANAVRNAQDSLSTAYWNTHDADGNWKKSPGDAGYQSDVDTYNAAVRAEQDAQTKLATAQLTYDNAVTQEGLDIASAEAKVRDAESQLATVQQGATTLELAQAQATLDQANASLTNLTDGGTAIDVAVAQASVDQARANLRKLRQGGTAAEIAAAKASVDQSQANFAKLTAPSTATDVEIQQASVDQAKQSLAQAELQRDYATLSAPFAGIITAVGIVPGSSAGGSLAAVHILDRSSLYVELKLSESDVAQVTLDQPVALSIDALSGWGATGKVTYISPLAETANGVVIYRVKISVPTADAVVKVGMTANVVITTAEKRDVLLVPNAALLPKGAGRAVQVPDGSGTREVEVTTGLSDGSFTEILSGLNEGDTIIALPGAITQTAPSGPFGGS